MVKFSTAFQRLPIPKHADVIALYAFIAIGLLSPIASNTILPEAPDHANHTACIIQAKQALDEGQFPLKVAPFQHDHLRYPLFQFYSQTPYLIGGLLYKYLTPANPWLALKLVYFTGLWFSAFFTFQTGRVLGFDKAASVLIGVVYMTSPYLLINIHARGAYTEAFAQFILPLLAYTAVRSVQEPTAARHLCLSLAWFALGTSHLITFAYCTVFYLLLAGMLYLWGSLSAKAAAFLVTGAGLGWLLSAFQWYPAATIRPLQIHFHLSNVFASHRLTPLPTLLSLTSTPAEPIGRPATAFLNASIGVPILIAIAGLLYFQHRLGPDRSKVYPLLLTFALAFFLVWSPVNFWFYLPQRFVIAQFTYRFLTYTAAAGTILFAYFLNIYRRQVGPAPLLLVLTALLLFARPYLPTLAHNSRGLADIIANPDLGHGAEDYLYATGAPASLKDYATQYEIRLPLISSDGWLMIGTSLPLSSAYIESAHPDLLLEGVAVAPGGLKCNQLQLTLDHSVIAGHAIAPGAFSWRIPYRTFGDLQDDTGQLAFVSTCGFIPHLIDSASADTRRLWIRVKTLRFEGAKTFYPIPPVDTPNLSLTETRQHCHMAGASVTCDFVLTEKSLVQIPVLFYPSLLDIRVNGNHIPYRGSNYGSVALAAIDLMPGHNKVVSTFAGSTLGNAGSILGVVIALGHVTVRRPKART